MKTVFLTITLSFLLRGCGAKETQASLDPPEIQCKILNAWEFKRCENSEVICYTNDNGLSCKWK